MKNFMLIVMREHEAITEDDKTVTVNSFGFAGTIAVKREADLELLKKYGCTGILEKLCKTP